MNVRYIILASIILMSSIACTKQEGYGGKSTIYGKVLERKYNNSGQFQSEYYVAEQRVYIVFGDDDFYSDEIRTDYEGKYKFSYLYPGKYMVYTYSECSPIEDCDSGIKVLQLQLNISKNGDVVVAEDFQTENW